MMTKSIQWKEKCLFKRKEVLGLTFLFCDEEFNLASEKDRKERERADLCMGNGLFKEGKVSITNSRKNPEKELNIIEIKVC